MEEMLVTSILSNVLLTAPVNSGGSQVSSGAVSSNTPSVRPEDPGAGGDGLSRVEEEEGVARLVAFGDVHSKSRWNAVKRLMDHEFPDGEGQALAVGDFSIYPEIENGHSIHFVHGNHEDFGRIADFAIKGDPTYKPISPGQIVSVGGLNVAGVPGIYNQSIYERYYARNFYITKSAVDAMMAMERSVDILLMHEAPYGTGFGLMTDEELAAHGDKPFTPGVKTGSRDPGVEVLNGVIEYLRPRLVLFGHHHSRFLGRLGETFVVGMDYPNRSYLTIEFDQNTDKLRVIEKRASLSELPNIGYRYSWQRAGSGQDDVYTLIDRRILAGREQEIFSELREKHYEMIHSELKSMILEYIESLPELEGGPNDHVSTVRASMALNRAMIFASKYANHREANPDIDRDGVERLLGDIYDRMCEKLTPGETDETLFAFRGCLRALGLIAG